MLNLSLKYNPILNESCVGGSREPDYSAIFSRGFVSSKTKFLCLRKKWWVLRNHACMYMYSVLAVGCRHVVIAAYSFATRPSIPRRSVAGRLWLQTRCSAVAVLTWLAECWGWQNPVSWDGVCQIYGPNSTLILRKLGSVVSLVSWDVTYLSNGV